MVTIDQLNKELISLQEEYNEVQTQAKQTEDFLGKKSALKEAKYNEILAKYTETITNYKNLKEKLQKNEQEISKLAEEVQDTQKKIQKFEDQKLKLQNLNSQWEKSAKILEYSKQTLEEKLYQAEESAILFKEELEELSQTRSIEVQRLKQQYNELKEELITVKLNPPVIERRKHRSPTAKLEKTSENIISIPKSSSRPASNNGSRKNSFEEGTTKQNVKVLVVFRPVLIGENWDSQVLVIDENMINIKEKNKETKTFEFEKIFAPGASQDLIFQELTESIEKLPVGGNACVMAYGQTGSGKTYTMNYLISTSLHKLSSLLNSNYTVSLQCIEVYNEQLKSLLNDEVLSKNWKEVLLKSEIKLGQNWKEEAWELVQKAISRRITKFTECNERSSRSHAIIWLTVQGPNGIGKVQFVDLAGSERIGKSQVVGETLKEALLINKSLSALQDVVTALENRQKHVPYRNSMLTQILQPTLGGSESIVTMVMNCSPASESINETFCTLALGSRIKAVDLGFFIRKNIITKEVEKTLSILEKERSQKYSLLRTLDKLQRELESFQIKIKDKDNRIKNINKKIEIQKNKSLANSGKSEKNQSSQKSFVGNKNRVDIRFESLSPRVSPPISPVMRSRIPLLVSLKLSKKN